MEPPKIYVGERASLRTKSPPKINPQPIKSSFKHLNHSPLRHSNSPHRKSPDQALASDNETQQYEIKRQIELRRQVREREAELQQLNQNKERLRLRIKKSLNLGVDKQQTNSGYKAQNALPDKRPKNNSPLRQSVNFDRSQVFKPSLNSIRGTTAPVDYEDNSTNRKLTPSAFRLKIDLERTSQHNLKDNIPAHPTNLSYAASVVHPSIPGPNYYLSQTLNDNSQLQLRLNLVVAELDRVKRENSQQLHHLASYEHEIDTFQRAINNEQRINQNAEEIHNEVHQQRETNLKFQQKIKEEEQLKADTIHQLNYMQVDRDRKVTNSQEMSHSLTHKLEMITNLQQENQNYQSMIQKISDQLILHEREIKFNQTAMPHLEITINQLKRERDDLVKKMHILTQNYEPIVHEMARERAQLDELNRRNAQLLASHTIFKALNQIVVARKQASINEFFNYCKFDKQCRRTIDQFCAVLHKLGHYQMKIGLKKWFINSLQPLPNRKISIALTDRFYQSKLKKRLFRLWQEKWIENRAGFSQKLKAAKMIWKQKCKDVKGDLQRSFLIWKNSTKLCLKKERALKLVLARNSAKLVRQALTLWKNYSIKENGLVRFQILSTQFVNNQLSLITLNQLKCSVAISKRIRLMKVAHLFKGWKDSIRYRRYMMAQNVQIFGNLRRNLNLRLMAACFQAIRHSKETQKYELMLGNLNDRYNPAISLYEDQLRQKSAYALKQKKLRCLEYLVKQAQCKVASYFYHWKMVLVGAETKIQKNLKAILNCLYLNQLQRAFEVWNQGQYFKVRKFQNGLNSKLDLERQRFAQDVDQASRSVEIEKARQERKAKLRLVRATNICISRYLRNGLRLWHWRCVQHNSKLLAAKLILQKNRKLSLRSALKMYFEKVRIKQQDEKIEARCNYYLTTREERLKRRVYNAFWQFTSQFGKSKNNLVVLFKNLNLWLKRRTFYRWIDQGNLQVFQLKKDCQNQNTIKFDDLNQELGKVVKAHTIAKVQNVLLNSKHTMQARRILAGYLRRRFRLTEERKFKQWVDVVKYQKHNEILLLRTINHWRKFKFEAFKSAFLNWKFQSKHKKYKVSIKRSELKTEEAIQGAKFNRDQHSITKAKLDDDIETSKDRALVLSYRIEEIIKRLTDCNIENNYQSKLRSIFTLWRAHTKRQTRFCKAITQVITKSIFQNGFSNINAFANDKKLTRAQNVACNGLQRMYRKLTLREALNRWRHNPMYKSVKAQTANLNESRIERESLHKAFFNKTQNFQGEIGTLFLIRTKLSNLWHAWRNVTKWQKDARIARETLKDTFDVYLIRLALKKWQNRKNVTVKFRAVNQKFYEKIRMIRLKAVFNGLKKRFNVEKDLGIKILNIVSKFDNRMKEAALESIRYQAYRKSRSNCSSKGIAARNFAGTLNQLYLSRMLSNFSDLRSKILRLRAKRTVLKNMLGHFCSCNLRQMFFKWKYQALEQSTVEEVNEEGPVVEEVLREQMRFENLKNFLQDQRYTTSEISSITNWAKERARENLARVVQRLLHYTKKSYLKPKMFDRWRFFVKQRQLLKYLLRNLENRLQSTKCDLSIAFNRWKFNKKYLLNGIDVKQLTTMCANNEAKKNKLNRLEDEADYYINLMGIQRGELVDNYMKSQRMAIALGKHNLERAQIKGLGKIKDHAQNQKKQNYELVLAHNINLIQNLKDRIKNFETRNESLASENVELREFSLDGYQIAKNVQNLNQDREKISVELADKARTIQKLLDQNQELSHRLRQAQEHAINLINQSNNNMRRMQAAQLGRYQPQFQP